jgi:putative ABC transport system permease protein
MDLLKLAVKDLARRKGKTLYLLIAVVIPVAILSTILSTLENADSSLSNLASKFGFTMIIQPKNIKIDRIDHIGVILDEYISEASIPQIENIIKNNTHNKDEAMIVATRLYSKDEVAHASSRSSSVIAGVEFDNETNARPSWSINRGRWPEHENEAVIGGTYSKSKDISYNDTITIRDREFTVVGILQDYNSSEDYMVFIPFRMAQALFEKEGYVSVINIQSVTLDKDKDLLKVVIGELNKDIPNIKALSPQQFSTMKYVLLKKTFKFLLSIVVATVIVSIFSIFNIVTTVLYSRVKEIGLLKSVGASRLQLLKIFIYEYFIIGLISGMIGYLLGLLVTYLLDSFLLDIGVNVGISLLSLLAALVVGIICSLVASYYPTYKLTSIKITETFKTQWEV